jgi:hypothetical protein
MAEDVARFYEVPDELAGDEKVRPGCPASTHTSETLTDSGPRPPRYDVQKRFALDEIDSVVPMLSLVAAVEEWAPEGCWSKALPVIATEPSAFCELKKLLKRTRNEVAKGCLVCELVRARAGGPVALGAGAQAPPPPRR